MLNEDNLMWYHIPGFNGYTIREDGLVKSLKFQYACPEGYVIKSHRNRNGDRYVVLSDDNNIRTKITIKELLNAVKNNEYKYTCDPNRPYYGSRNKVNMKQPVPKNNQIVKLNLGGFGISKLVSPITFL